MEKAAELCKHEPLGRLVPADFELETLCRLAAQADLLVNGTSLGMAGTGGQFEDFTFLDALPREAPVVDLIYHPAETELLRQARLRGHRTANGMGLLIHQAILALEHFTGVPIDAGEMGKLLQTVLRD